MRRSASEILRNLERRVARLERKTSTSRRASRTPFFDKVVREVLRATGGMIKVSAIVDQCIQLVDMYIDNWREYSDEEYEEIVSAPRMQKLIQKGILGATYRETASIRHSDSDRSLLAEALFQGDADDMAEIVADYFEDMLD